MYSLPKLAAKYLSYYVTASNGKGHGIHSPFVFDFVLHVLNDNHQYPEYRIVETLRKELRKENTLVTVEDLGAGSSISAGSSRTVSSIARSAAKPRKYGQLLYRLARYYEPASILELGTSLGISTAYLALGGRNSTITTIEGAPEVAQKALNNLDKLELQRVNLLQGSFENRMPQALEQLSGSCLVFIDGNHRLDPTLNYFYQVLPYMHSGSMIVFDDIHWSEEMEEAWRQIQSHPDVLLTVDLFFIGIVFFRKDFLIKQHFIIRF